MSLPIVWLVLLLVCCLNAQECLPVVTLNNATLTRVNEPLTQGNIFEAQIVNPANPVIFKVFPSSGKSFRYDFTLIVYKGKCTPNSTSEHVARSKSSSILRITVPEANAAFYTAYVVSDNGGSYEIQYCERACEEPCEKDCSTHGYCNTTAQECYCFSKWSNPSCSSPTGGGLVLFGSTLIAIAVFIVLPVLFAIIIVICGVACWFQNKRKNRRTAPMVIYQKFPYEIKDGTKNSDLDESSESQPLISTPKYY